MWKLFREDELNRFKIPESFYEGEGKLFYGRDLDYMWMDVSFPIFALLPCKVSSDYRIFQVITIEPDFVGFELYDPLDGGAGFIVLEKCELIKFIGLLEKLRENLPRIKQGNQKIFNRISKEQAVELGFRPERNPDTTTEYYKKNTNLIVDHIEDISIFEISFVNTNHEIKEVLLIISSFRSSFLSDSSYNIHDDGEPTLILNWQGFTELINILRGVLGLFERGRDK